MRLRQHFSQHRAANGIHRARPQLFLQRAGLCEVAARQDGVGAELAKVIVRRLAARYGCHPVAERFQQYHGGAADPAAGAGDQDITAFRGDARTDEGIDAQHCGKAGGADDHRLARAECLRQGNQPVAFDTGLGGQTAPVVFAHAPAGEDHGLAGNKARIAAFTYPAGKINPRHHRELADDFAFAGDRQGIFIVETRPVDGDPHVAFGKGGQVNRFDGGHGAVVNLVQN